MLDVSNEWWDADRASMGLALQENGQRTDFMIPGQVLADYFGGEFSNPASCQSAFERNREQLVNACTGESSDWPFYW